MGVVAAALAASAAVMGITATAHAQEVRVMWFDSWGECNMASVIIIENHYDLIEDTECSQIGTKWRLLITQKPQ